MSSHYSERSKGTSGESSNLRSAYEAVCKERDQLKLANDRLHREMEELKKSVYEYSMLVSSNSNNSGKIFSLRGRFPQKSTRNNTADSTALTQNAENLSQEILRENNQRSENIPRYDSIESNRAKETEGRYLRPDVFLKGHIGAVYTVEFSSDCLWLASGGFDKTVRLWEAKYPYQQVVSLSEHNALIYDIAWSPNCHNIVSGGFDGMLKFWDIDQGTTNGSTHLPGFVQAVEYDPTDNNIVYAGTSRAQLSVIDTREGSSIASTWETEAMITGLYVYRDGTKIITGDSMGMIKTWDARMGKVIEEYKLENGVHISCLHSSTPQDEFEGRFLAANCYDNSLRVLYRRPNDVDPSQMPSLQQLHVLRGHTNQNWPIRSSFYQGIKHRVPPGLGLRRNPNGDLFGGLGFSNNNKQSKKEAGIHGLEGDIENGSQVKNDWQHSLMLSTGSIDGNIYTFDMSQQLIATPTLVQVLKGHTDRVYSVQYHPSEPILASGSADSTIGIWTANKRKKNVNSNNRADIS